MMTHQAFKRRHSDAGRRSTAWTDNRLRRVLMTFFSLIALVCAAVSWAAVTPATAQTQAPAPAPAAEPATDPAQKGPDIERIKDWSFQCTQPQADKPRSCFAIHDVFPNEGNVRILQMVVGRFGEENLLGALFFVPLGIRLPPGLTVQIDKNEPIRLQIERCTSKGCQAQIALAEPFLSLMKAGSGGEVTFEDATGRLVAVPFSLQGFTAALAKLP
jgi:invasion protein IalB